DPILSARKRLFDASTSLPGARSESGPATVSLSTIASSLVVHRRGFPRDDVPAQFPASTLHCPASKLFAQLLAHDNALHCLRQRADVLRWNQQTIVLIGNNVRQPADAGGDDGPAKAEGQRGDTALRRIRIRKHNGSRSLEYLRNFVSVNTAIHQFDPG